MDLIEIHVDGRPVPLVRFTDPQQRPLVIPQSRTETILLRRLEELGGSVHWRHTLSGFEAGPDRVQLAVEGPDGRQALQARFLVGCDGAHSPVRKGLGLPFDGDSYHQDFIQIDCRAGGDGLPDDRILVYLDADQALVTMPLGGGVLRAILLRRRRPEGAPEVPEPHEFEAALRAHGRNVYFHDITWAVRFHLHERMVPQHRVGPVFLAGDAAHVHTPAGGLGMNTGIHRRGRADRCRALPRAADGRARGGAADGVPRRRDRVARPARGAVHTAADPGCARVGRPLPP